MSLTLRRSCDDKLDHFAVFAGEVRIGTIYFAVNINKSSPALVLGDQRHHERAVRYAVQWLRGEFGRG